MSRAAMAEVLPDRFPLLSREASDILFLARHGSVTVATFLGAAHHLAQELPEGTHVVNLCRDRFRFAQVFAASLLRGQLSLLTADRSPDQLGRLAAAFPGATAVSDDPGEDFDAVSPLRTHRIDPAAPLGFAEGPNLAIAASQPAAIVFTSGSTGEPVAHRKLWGALVSRSIDAAMRFGFRARHPAFIVGTVPPQHMYGFETTILLPFSAPVAIWCGPAFYPRDVHAALAAAAAPRVLVTTPLQLRALLEAPPQVCRPDRVISATAPLASELAAAAEQRWKTRVFEIFGATEVGSIASRRTLAGDVWAAYPRVRLTQEPGGDGETVLVAGPYADPYPLSDRVERLGAGHFRLLGRRTDIVKLGGRRTSLAALNRVLAGIEGVTDGIFVAPANLEERPTARLLTFVVAPDRTSEEILGALRGKIDPIFLPRRVVRVERLPRNEIGKLSHQALRALGAVIEDD
jgi:acyl-coenzyme A synthetase/AMP-(fatty) acid ligase